jgi:hypothetical protein
MDAFLFGAGASTFACSCSAARPPLGPGLFSALVDAQPEIRNVLTEEAWRAFSEGRPFEEAMEIAWQIGSTSVAPFLRAMAKYLASFEPCACASNAYRRLLIGLRRRQRRLCFATLNYDLLFDRLVHEQRFNIVYGDRPTPTMVSMLRPHGGANLLPVLHGELRNVEMHTEIYFEGLPVEATLSSDRISAWCNDPSHDCLAPVMSVYAVGKRTPINSGWVVDQRRLWSELVRRANRVAIVGVKLVEQDEHIWAPLAENRGALLYVNPNVEDQRLFSEWSRRTRGHAPAEGVTDGFREAVPLLVRRFSTGL